MPGALSYPMNMPRYDWGFTSEPEPFLDGRKLACPRGKVVGGSSSINGMVYVRGHALDYDTWSEMGAAGWAYADTLPYFKKLENWNSAGHGGDPTWRGNSGPLHVTRGSRSNELVKAFVNAGHEAGYEITEDYNGQKQEGFGPMDQTIFQGQRWSAAKAYLRPAIKTGRCRLVSGFARKILIEKGRATGVEYDAKNKTKAILHARKEVILSASSINSPKLLMLSGIGPAAHLKEHGIKVLADRPGVGKNLQDHLELYLQMAASEPITLYKYWGLLGKAYVGLRWLVSRTGPGASNQFESAAFIRSKAGVKYPDIQYHLLPVAVNYDGSSSFKGHGFQLHVGPMRSKSRGWVRIKSNKLITKPEIKFNYMSHPDDWVDFRNCIKNTRKILQQLSFSNFCGKEIQPGENVTSNNEIDQFIIEKAESAYHPCGTMKMGQISNPMSVVDPECKVIGVKNLRVIDASVMPYITSGNTNAPTIMIAEKGADMILKQ